MNRGFSLVLASFGLVLSSPRSGAVTLAEHGVARAVIVVENAANRLHATAAQDLQRHLQRATGAAFAIVDEAGARGVDPAFARLLVGAGRLSRAAGGDDSDLAAEAYRVVGRGNTIVFVGHDTGTSNATAWAVGSFLDRQLGVRWLWPGELGTHVPRAATIIVPDFDLTGRPALEQRRLRSRAEGAESDWLRHHQMGSRMTYRFGHAFNDWWEKYHETHPDYFAVPPAGERQPYPRAEWVKLRLGNPAVADQMIANWRAAGRPDNWNVCPNDGSGWDTSAAARAMDLPDRFTPEDIWRNKANLTRRFVRFWNGLIERMRAENPRVTLSTYAYSCYRNPPIDVKLQPGMVLGMVQGYAETDDWLKWHGTGAKMILRPNWWHLGGSAPHLPLQAQGAYFRTAEAHGMIGFDFDSLLGQWGNQGALYYLIARLSTRADLTVDDVIGEYAGAFGRAAPLIRDYLDYWEAFTRRIASPIPAGGDVSQNRDGLYETVARQLGVTGSTLAGTWVLLPYLYTDEVIAPAEAILARAAAVVAAEDAFSRRRVGYLQAALALLKEHREVVRLADKKRRKPGETNATLVRQIEVFEALRQKTTNEYGPIGFEETLPSRLKIQDPRQLEGR